LEVLGEAVEEGLVEIVFYWLFLQGVYIVGRGGTLTPPPSHQGRWPGEEKGPAARARKP
jgi:hypothetical protein